ncbi:AraC family transcriptional regulator of arabinose operon [Paenibacillus taihuensis]|uniref:AraC family transcriptional regulator of arabinose operon n=1 Tax=Paenibacillus taihuensis TaxID=1156355 RepID=A0A3D9QV00_9BACL|nr:AraC family transcriptional regulator [Paenibacillus taihuensis]REE67676.1 AraC family transcriptional regulator of arabinose operon [Paenibacillus taihuensis]
MNLPFAKITSIQAGTIVYPPRGTYGPRVQQDIQLVLLHTGELDITIDGAHYHVKPGQVVLLKPQHHEHFAFAKTQESWHRWIALSVESLTESEIAYLDTLPFSMPIPEALNTITDMMLSLKDDGLDHNELMVSLGYAAFQLFTARIAETKQQQELHPSIRLALTHVQQHYTEEVSLQELASAAGVSPEHLVRLFHGYNQMTPIRYLWHYRVLKATELLTQSGLSVGEIAARCGFKTVFHLSRLVKEQTGSTPTDIRKSAWGTV